MPRGLDRQGQQGGQHERLRTLYLAALGIVFGDIGTSPLYALRECFHGPHAVAAERANVLGVLSLVLWSLIVVISVKYVVFVMRADNQQAVQLGYWPPSASTTLRARRSARSTCLP